MQGNTWDSQHALVETLIIITRHLVCHPIHLTINNTPTNLLPNYYHIETPICSEYHSHRASEASFFLSFIRQIFPFVVLLQTYSPNGVVLKEFPSWCCLVRGLHGFCMETASFNGEFVSTGHVDIATRYWCWRYQGKARPASGVGDFKAVLKSQL